MSRPPALKLETVPGGPEAGTLLCAVGEIPDGGARKFKFRNDKRRFEMFIQRRGEKIFAYKNSCPHAGLPLDNRPGKFLDYEKAHLFCASHGARFRIEDGYCLLGPCKGQSLRAVDIYIEGGMVLTG